MNLAGEWVGRVHQRKSLKQIIFDMDSSVSPTYGNQEGTAYNGYFQCVGAHCSVSINMAIGSVKNLVCRAKA